MAFKYTLEVLAVLAILGLCGIFLFTSSNLSDAEFAGSDTVGSSLVSELSGIPEDEFTPIVPQWEPPSGEIESCLFALQAAIGGILIGGVFGFWLGQKQ
ncbi:energy-coupling factor ABC transporter substrate-binding protein, partial [Methanoregula sp.]|uniref:energy-coupling factor ABC transporter substrate-binding protein n=1 Tax=Methanoregula sp. TaxID=2052170 RepID=UPI000CBF07FC